MRIFPATASLLFLGVLSLSAAQPAVDFSTSIRPVIEARCIECHGPEKQKGQLRLDRKPAMDADGVIVPGNARQSELYRRIMLPADDEEHMPNEGKPLTTEQTNLIRDWINQGASWPEGLVLKQAVIDRSLDYGLPVAPAPSAAETQALTELAAADIRVVPVAAATGWHEANLRFLGARLTDATLPALGRVVSLRALDLTGTGVTDAGLVSLRGLNHLTRLQLGRTAITDAGLENLRGLGNLVTLNLHGTATTDAGLERLHALKHLQKIYLWETKTTEEGRRKLQTALPNAQIFTGMDPNQLPIPTPEGPPAGSTEAPTGLGDPPAKAESPARAESPKKEESAKKEETEAK